MAPIEIGGPQQFGLDALVRRALAVWKDPREVVADPQATYYGVMVSEKTLSFPTTVRAWAGRASRLGSANRNLKARVRNNNPRQLKRRLPSYRLRRAGCAGIRPQTRNYRTVEET